MVRKISQEQIDKIYEAYNAGMMIPEAADYAKVSKSVVCKYWKKKGLETHFKNGLKEEKINKIYEAHGLGMTQKETAEYSETSITAVQKYWKKAGLKSPIKRGGQRKISDKQIKKIYEAHELGMSSPKAAKYVGIGKETVLNYWKKEGLRLHYEKPQSLSQKQIKKIYEAHELGMSSPKAAKYVGINPSTVLKYWKKKRLEYKTDLESLCKNLIINFEKYVNKDGFKNINFKTFVCNYNFDKEKINSVGSGGKYKRALGEYNKINGRFYNSKKANQLPQNVQTLEDYVIHHLPTQELKEKAHYYISGDYLKDLAKKDIDSKLIKEVLLE